MAELGSGARFSVYFAFEQLYDVRASVVDALACFIAAMHYGFVYYHAFVNCLMRNITVQ